MTETEQVERSEEMVGQLTRIDDAIRRQQVDPTPVMPAVEQMITAMDGAGMSRRQKWVIADSLRKEMA